MLDITWEFSPAPPSPVNAIKDEHGQIAIMVPDHPDCEYFSSLFAASEDMLELLAQIDTDPSCFLSAEIRARLAEVIPVALSGRDIEIPIRRLDTL